MSLDMKFIVDNIEDLVAACVGFTIVLLSVEELAVRFVMSVSASILSGYIVHKLKEKYWTKHKKDGNNRRD